MTNILENKLFPTACLLIFILTLFYGMDYMALWNVETEFALASLAHLSEGILFSFDDGFSPLPELIMSGSFVTVGESEWAVRFPSLILLAAALFSFYKTGSKIFSEKSTLLSVLLSIASFPIILISKLGLVDIWLLALPLFIFPLTIVQLKQPALWKNIALITLFIVMSLVQALSALLFCVSLYGILYLFHPNKKNLLIPVISSILSIVLITLVSGQNWIQDGFLFNYGQNLSWFFVLSILGLLSGFGFIPAVIMNLFSRLKRKEELSIISLAGMLAGLFSVSWFFHFMIIFLIGKQIESYTKENYPYRKSVKIFTVVQVVFSFFLASVLLMYSYNWFGGLGFRKALFLGCSLWGMGILSLVGLVSLNRNYIIIASVLGGVLFNFLLWTQYIPVWEAERNYIKDISFSAFENKKEIKDKNIYLSENLSENSSMEFYRKTKLQGLSVGYSRPTERDDSSRTLYVLDHDTFQIDSTFLIIDNIKGRDFPWEKMKEFSITMKK